MVLTLDVPDELAAQLERQEDLPKILEMGLREQRANAQAGFQGALEVLETLARLPSPQEVLALRPSPTLEERVRELLEKNREEGLLPEEEREWEQLEFLEHLVRLAKAQARARLAAS